MLASVPSSPPSHPLASRVGCLSLQRSESGGTETSSLGSPILNQNVGVHFTLLSFTVCVEKPGVRSCLLKAMALRCAGWMGAVTGNLINFLIHFDVALLGLALASGAVGS